MAKHEQNGPDYPMENALVIEADEAVILPEPPPPTAEERALAQRHEVLHAVVMTQLGAPPHRILRLRDDAVDQADRARIEVCDQALAGIRWAVEALAPACAEQAAADAKLEAERLAEEQAKAEAERKELEAALAVLEMVDAQADTEPEPTP